MSEFDTLISAADLQRSLGSRNLRIVDCRFDLMHPAAGRAAWLEAHIPGAVHADLDGDLAGPVTRTSGRHPLPRIEAAVAMVGRLGIGNDSRVVVYDSDSGAIAARAWWMLHWLGHRRVALLNGGFAGWKGERRPIEPGEQRNAPQEFAASVNEDCLATTESIEQKLRNNTDFCLVDARDAARFAGDVEPIDPVAGHIPGAVNLPFSRNLTTDGRWKTVDELRELWTEAVGTRADGEWSVMCGSGVTACHLALSAMLVGLRPPALYAGSWSEWIRDPDRPVVTGP